MGCFELKHETAAFYWDIRVWVSQESIPEKIGIAESIDSKSSTYLDA